MLNKLGRRLSNLFQRGTLTLVDDNSNIQQVQVTLRSGQVREKREHPTNYGFTHNPPVGLEDIHMASQGGNTAKGVVLIVGDRKFRLKGLAQGEVALYDDQDQVVHIKREGILIKSSKKLTVDTPLSTFTGDVIINGNLRVDLASVLMGAVNATTSVITPIVTASTSIAAPAITAVTSLIVAGKNMLTHTHPGDSGGNTGGPN